MASGLGSPWRRQIAGTKLTSAALPIQPLRDRLHSQPISGLARLELVAGRCVLTHCRHEIGCELKAISQWLDGQRALVSLVAAICVATDCARPDAMACGETGAALRSAQATSAS